MTTPISEILVQDRSRKTMRNVESLARSIRERGLLHPVVVREVDGQLVLVAGQRRIEAARSLGWTDIPVTVVTTLDDEMDALCAEGEENTEREPFTPAEAVEHRRRIREVEAKAAKDRQREAGREHGNGIASSNLERPKSQAETKTRHRTAKATGYSASTLDKAEEIVAAANDETEPEPVREAAKAAVTNLSNPGAKVDREFKAFQAERAMHNPALASAEYRKNLAKALGHATLLPQFKPEQVVDAVDDDLTHLIDSTCKAIADWHAEIIKARGSGLRVVQGGQK